MKLLGYKLSACVCFILLRSVISFSQNDTNNYKFVGLTSFSGEINVMGQYRKQNRSIQTDISESLESTLLSGGILLRTSGYVWHPNFLVLGIDANYNPETKQENYLIIPDRSEVKTLQRLYVTGTFFKQKPISLTSFVNLNKNYINNENLTNLRSNDKKYGGSLYLKNKYIPLTVSYVSGKWDQKELISNRAFKNEHTGIQGRIVKSFSSRDNHKLTYNYNDYVRQDNNLSRIENRTNEISLNDNIFFDRDKKYYFSSIITNFNQEGNDTFERFQARENLTLKLPENFSFNSNYFLNNIQQESQSSNQHQIRCRLNHELYLSLKTSIYYEYSNLNHTAYQETNDKQGINIKYTKKIYKGQLSLDYNYSRYNQDMDSKPVILQLIREEHSLLDEEMVLLDKEFIDIGSIVIKDVTGTIIYQENLDYVVIERNSLIEIQRIPGGQITNGQLVYVDYINTRKDSFKYVINNNAFSANVSFFNRLIEFYYRISKQNYTNVEKSDYLVLNYYTQNVYGTRFRYKIFHGGIEYDDYNSDLIPYKLLRYFVQVQGRLRKKILYSVNINFRDYKIINDETNQKFADVSAKITYNFNSRSMINVETAYRNQTGREIDLKLFTLRSEFTSVVRQMYFTVGAEMYSRNYLNDNIDFIGAYCKIVRKF